MDVGKLISLANLLVRKITWFVLRTTSAPLILSFGADHMARIAYIYSRLPRTHSLTFSLPETVPPPLSLSLTHFDLQRQYTHSLSLSHFDLQCQYSLSLSHFDFQRQYSLSLTFWLTETVLSLSLSLSHTHTLIGSYLILHFLQHSSSLQSKRKEEFVFLTFITIYIRGDFNKFPDFFVQEFKIVVDS